MSVFKLTYKSFGATAVLIEWPQKIDKDILNDIIQFKIKINQEIQAQIQELKSSYNVLLVVYRGDSINFNEAFKTLNAIYESQTLTKTIPRKLWKIPVCYEDAFALDLALMSKEKGLSKAEIINCHSQGIYTVFFIGFLPGFLYLGGLDKALHMPRKSSPRLQIKKGAVAIGGAQTGVYPSASPGGWNIIGNSPVNFFDVLKAEPCFAKTGDAIQFYPVSLKIYQDIKTLVDAGVYQLESEVWHG